jgi:hypothetical protein
METTGMESGVLITQLYGNSGWTDHYSCFLLISQSKPNVTTPKTFRRRKNNSVAEREFRENLSKADFTPACCNDPTKSLENLMSIIVNLQDECLPFS